MIDRQVLAQHIIRAIARDHLDGRRSDLDTLTETVGAPRAEIRSAITDLHREGYLDALRMKLTLEGFALGVALSTKSLPALDGRPSVAA